jgi:hypothetical protein
LNWLKNTKLGHIHYCAYNDINAPVLIHFDVVLYLVGKLILAENQKQTGLTKSTRFIISDLLTRYEECSCSCSTYNQTLSENQEERVETDIDNNNGLILMRVLTSLNP